MTDPTPTPDLAAIIAAAREFAKAERFGESCCWCPGTLRCKEALSGKPCPSFLALIDAASGTAEAEAKLAQAVAVHGDMLVELRTSEARVRELTEAGQSVLDYKRGIGKFNFSRLPDADRSTAALEAWEKVEDNLLAALSASPPPAQPVPVMPEAVGQEWLNELCGNCGERLGRHAAFEDTCPRSFTKYKPAPAPEQPTQPVPPAKETK